MYRVLDIDSEGRVAELTGDLHVAPPPEGVVRWIDLEKQDAAQLALLAERFKFHPLTIEDCAHFNQRPKVDEYPDYLFIVTHGFELSPSPECELTAMELHTFLSERYVVTVHDEPIAPLEAVWQRLKSERGAAQHGADFISYLIADGVVDMYFPVVDSIADEVETLEEEILSGPEPGDTLGRLFRLKRVLVRLRKVVGPQRDVFAHLSKRGSGPVGERTALYFRDVQDHVFRISEALEMARVLLSGALDAHLWSGSQRTNEIMKRLTLLSAILLPRAFITGFFGQNFERMPFGSQLVFVAMLVSCVVVPGGMLYFFLRSRWF